MCKRSRTSIFIMLSLCVLITGCSLMNTITKTPLEWITLANSGLSGRDNYSYSGHVETGINENIQMSTLNFTGQVHSHQEYSINSEEIDTTLLHPSKYMDIINKSQNSLSFVQEPLDAEAKLLTVKLLIEEQQAEATSRWKAVLQQQFNQIKLSVGLMNVEQVHSDEVAKFIIDSENELKEMLNTLQVDCKYTLIIDTNHAIPLSLEEYAILNYKKENKGHSEYRRTKIQINYK